MCGRTPGSQTPASPATPEPSTTKNSSSSRAPKKIIALKTETLRPSGRSPKNGARSAQKTPPIHHDGNLRHLRLSPGTARTCRCKITGTSQPCRCPAQQGNRPPCQYCNCGTSTVFSTGLPSQNLRCGFRIFCTVCTVRARLSGITGMSNTLTMNRI